MIVTEEIIKILEQSPNGRSIYLLQRKIESPLRTYNFLFALSELLDSRRVICQHTFFRGTKTHNATNVLPSTDIEKMLLNATDIPPIIGNSSFVGPVWEPAFAQALWNSGLKIVQQYPTEGYSLDIALLSMDPLLKIDIEVDGRSTHCDRHGRRKISDVIRDARLKQAGWIVKRFWVRELMDDMNACVMQVEQLLRELKLKRGE
jgi:very-short-patch-repair endonuclease